MADRVSASITIGGTLAATLVENFIAAITCEGLSSEWGGEPFVESDIAPNAPLELFGHEVAWGVFSTLEAFCRDHKLPYRRQHDAFSSSWGSGSSVYRGAADTAGNPVVDDYDVSADGTVMIDSRTVTQLGSYDAVLTHFVNADFNVPPMSIGSDHGRGTHVEESSQLSHHTAEPDQKGEAR